MKNAEHILLSESDRKWCLENKVEVTWPGQPDYPIEFLPLSYRPAFLFYQGKPVWLTHRLISVVGSRAPQTASLQWMEKVLARKLVADPSLAVVSGGARGVDQKAHQIALRLERPTVLFMPSGLRCPYPFDLCDWTAPILNYGGCLISPFLPSMQMEKKCFRERNRLIAAISPATLVIECRRRSGTMLTARYAAEFDKQVYVMPTAPGDAGMGGLDLICDSYATPVRDESDMGLV